MFLMDLKNLLLFVFIFYLGATFNVHSQVGINTITPRKTLEVGGNVKISDTLTIKEIHTLKDDDTSTFLIQDSQNYISIMDVSNPTGTALGYIQEYLIVNPDLDWVLDFDTLVNASQYVLNIISANFDRELEMSPENKNSSSIPYSSAFIRDGTWHIIADYPVASNRYKSEIGTWTITTLIYSKDLSKQFGTIEIQMNNKTTGSATNPIIN